MNRKQHMRTMLADKVRMSYRAIREMGRSEIWISLMDEAKALEQADRLTDRLAEGEPLPLAGLIAAVKDNIDVAGFDTTAGSRRYAYTPEHDATAVARLRQAGAIVIGKTNLDQFATGLVGTRSPFGAVRNAWDPERVSGGSSSGSAVAVALGLVDIALGTDTAGSGRVPAALNGIVGIKPTRGRIPVTGVVPACESLDCVTVFARDFNLAERVVDLLAGPDDTDPYSLRDDYGCDAALHRRIGIPHARALDALQEGWAAAFEAEVERFRAVGYEIVEIDERPLLDAAKMLYGTSLVAERYSAVGDFVERNRDAIGADLNTTVANIILDGGKHTASELFDDQAALKALGVKANLIFDGIDALLTPTTTIHPSIEAVNAEPVSMNSAMGRFTNFANLLDKSAVAIPAGFVHGMPFGVMLTAPAYADHRLGEIVRSLGDCGMEIFVAGAHMLAQPLNRQLVSLGASFVRDADTAPEYRLVALDGSPARPGVVRVGDGGASIAGEIWSLPRRGIGDLLGMIPSPLGLGTVALADGGMVSGFICEGYATDGCEDITSYGGWRAWLAATEFTESGQ
jgi:allophanate hydrolase